MRRLVSRRLRQLRGDVTQKTLAGQAGVSVYVIGKIEREETTPTVETLHRLCRALGVTLGEFFAAAPSAQEAKDAIEALGHYLADKRLEDIQFADQVLRTVIDRLDAERRRAGKQPSRAKRPRSRPA